MPKKEVPLVQLADYLPQGTYELVAQYLHHYKVHLTVAKSRSSVLGDYRRKFDTQHHRISVNGNLNPYAFLITLLHELAHLLTYEKYSYRVQAHGKEWKTIYGQVLEKFLQEKIFPADVAHELLRTLQNPGASTCAEEGLQRVLYRYDDKKQGCALLEDISEGTIFSIAGKRRFIKGSKRRKRFICREIATGKNFLFSGVYEVRIEE